MAAIDDHHSPSQRQLYTVALLPLLVLMLAVLCVRLPALHTRAASTLSVGTVLMRLFQALGCAVNVAAYVLILVTAQSEDCGFEDCALDKASWVAGACSWACGCTVVLLEARAGRHAGRSLRLWWLLALVLAAARLAHDGASAMGEPVSVQTIIQMGVASITIVLGLIGFFEPDTPSDRAYASASEGLDAKLLVTAAAASTTRKPNAEATASFASRLAFAWCNSILARGARRALEHDDCFDLQLVDQTGSNAHRLDANWQRERATKRGSFWHACHATWGRTFWLSGLLELVRVAATFAVPQLNRKLLDYLAAPPGAATITFASAILLAALTFLLAVLQSLCSNQYNFNLQRLMLRTQAAVGQCVFRKALRLAHRERQRFGTGAITSYMQVDAQKFGQSLTYSHALWSAPLQMIVGTAMLVQFLGTAGLCGLGVMVLAMPLQGALGARMMKVQNQVLSARDRRVKFTNEILQGVRLLKLFAWEATLSAQLEQLRADELRAVWAFSKAFMLLIFAITALPVVYTAISFAVYTMQGHELTPSNAFAALMLFNLLNVPISFLPLVVTFAVVEVIAVNKRLSKFMRAPERESIRLTDAAEPLTLEDGHYSGPAAAPGALAIEAMRASFRWPEAQDDEEAAAAPAAAAAADQHAAGTEAAALVGADAAAELPPTLSDLTLGIPSGTVVGVAGPVGCGKTSLLCALINDIPRVGGRVVVRGRVAYCAQEPWIQNATLRENVLFGAEYESRRYSSVLSACALDVDLRLLAHGDATVIGERGINLSGGQKARVALARACYAAADVYLLDDVLAAVDAEVGLHLWTKCIHGLLRRRGHTVVFVTHHRHTLEQCDLVVQLSLGGRIEHFGTPAELAARGVHLSAAAPAAAPAAAADAADASNADTVADVANAANAADASAAADEADVTPPCATPHSTQAPPLSRRVSSGRLPSSRLSEASGEPLTPRALALKRQLSAKARAAPELPEEEEEDRARGTVGRAVWGEYLSAIGATTSAFVLFIYAVGTVASYGQNWWIAQWSAARFGDSTWMYIGVNLAISFVACVLVLVRTHALYAAAIRAARMLHEGMLRAVLGAPMAFFDTTPTGRLLNRFSKDLQVVDMQLAGALGQVLVFAFRIVGALYFIVAGSSLWILLSFPLLGLLYLAISRYYRASTRELQRLDSVSKSPIYAAFAEALNGAATIQATDSAAHFEAAQRARFDHNLQPQFLLQAVGCWFAMRLELFSNTIAGLAAMLCIAVSSDMDPRRRAASAGLALTYAPLLTEYTNQFLKQFTSLETQMVSVERLHSYSQLAAEERAPPPPPPPPSWPHAGGIIFSDVVMRYRLELPDVLRGASFAIAAAEKVGVCGRTASGKSTLLVCLFRLAEVRAGTIHIDGVDIARVPLAALRARLAIIPQEPVLFTGPLRYNLDPFDEWSDEEVSGVLRSCSIEELAQAHPDGLRCPLEEGGGNLSAGQRQLVCMARALLRRAKVLVLDEATASIDMETDDIIQATLREQLHGVTVLTIAHRLNTILDYDKVLVMDQGKLAEFGPPAELRQRPGGKFRELLDHGAAAAQGGAD